MYFRPPRKGRKDEAHGDEAGDGLPLAEFLDVLATVERADELRHKVGRVLVRRHQLVLVISDREEEEVEEGRDEALVARVVRDEVQRAAKLCERGLESGCVSSGVSGK